MGIQFIVSRSTNVNVSCLDAKALVPINESSLINFSKAYLNFDSGTSN